MTASAHQAGCSAHGAPIVLRLDDLQGRPMARIASVGCIAWSVDPALVPPHIVRAIEREARLERVLALALGEVAASYWRP